MDEIEMNLYWNM